VGQVVISGSVGLGEGVEMNYPASYEGKYGVGRGVSVLYSSFLLLKRGRILKGRIWTLKKYLVS
jgi:hypothetical protein